MNPRHFLAVSAIVMTSTNDPPFPRAWWKSAVVYQIYPSSFYDSNGDGIGDLKGIESKLDYLKNLGVDVVWLSPIYKSPQADMGYDISDYRDIDPRYGTLTDWDDLIKSVHNRGMKLMMDLVVNHTSDEHEWFKESRSSKTNPKRDWYIWRPAKYTADGTRLPPNNWKAAFEGSVWEWDETTQEYYLHLYVPGQPDLNWVNPEVREAVWSIMRFWIERGCDGFRQDVINLISKRSGLPDAPVTDPGQFLQPAFELFANGPKVHDYLKEMNTKVLSNYDIMTVGETPFTHDPATLASYVLPSNQELQMVFQFELCDLDSPLDGHNPLTPRPWTVPELGAIISRWQCYKREEGYWNAVFIENHDNARSVSRFGNDSTPELQALTAKLLAMMQITQSGTIYVYQGEELGLKNFPLSWGIEEYKDVATINHYNVIKARRQKEQGLEDVDMSDVIAGAQKKARDHSRTPMQWDSSRHGGFTTGTPWMRVNDDYVAWNATKQLDDENSTWAFWRQALRLRKEYDLLIYGDFVHLTPDHERILAYTRSLGTQTVFVCLNFRDAQVNYDVPLNLRPSPFVFIFGNYASGDGGDWGGGRLQLRPYEGRLYFRSD